MRSWISQTKHTPKSSCIWINEAFPTPKAHICIFQSLFLLSNIINSSNLFNFINKIIPFTKRTIKRYKNGVSLTLFVRFICVLIGKTCSFPLLYDISLCRYTPRSSSHPSIHAEVSCLFLTISHSSIMIILCTSFCEYTCAYFPSIILVLDLLGYSMYTFSVVQIVSFLQEFSSSYSNQNDVRVFLGLLWM